MHNTRLKIQMSLHNISFISKRKLNEPFSQMIFINIRQNNSWSSNTKIRIPQSVIVEQT